MRATEVQFDQRGGFFFKQVRLPIQTDVTLKDFQLGKKGVDIKRSVNFFRVPKERSAHYFQTL